MRKLTAIILLLCFISSAAFADEITKKRKELYDVYTKLAKEKEKLRATKKKEEEVLGRLFVIGRRLKQTREELARTKKKLLYNEQKLALLRTDVHEARRKFRVRAHELKKRIRKIFKGSGINYLELILSAKSLSDFINRSYYLEKVVACDIKFVSEVKKEYDALREKETSLRQTTQKVKKLTQEVKNRESYVSAQKQEKRKIYNILHERRKEHERRVAEFENTSRGMEKLIRRLIAQRTATGITAPQGTGKLMWPLRGKITSPFGYRRHPIWGGWNHHSGIDVGSSYGAGIRAADSGEVVFSGWWDGYGKAIIVDHGRGISTVYGHLSRIYVQKGKKVYKGQVVGLVGSTGYSTGPHLHFEVRKRGTPVNPMPLLPR